MKLSSVRDTTSSKLKSPSGYVSVDKDDLDSTEKQSDSLGKELWIAVSKNRTELQRAGETRAAQQWLQPQLNSPEGTQQVYGLMEGLAAKQSFLTKLAEAQNSRGEGAEKTIDRKESCLKICTQQAEWWEAPSTGSDEVEALEETLQNDTIPQQSVTQKAASTAEPLDSYIMVEKEDVLEAIGSFVAAYIAELPQAQNLPPAELQLAITKAFKELRKGKLQQLWGWGRAIYRCVSFSYGAFTVYENPWLVRALLMAMWTASRVMLGLII